jgi:hypothetical protein
MKVAAGLAAELADVGADAAEAVREGGDGG